MEKVLVYEPLSCRWCMVDPEALVDFAEKHYLENPERLKVITINDLYDAMGLPRILFGEYPRWVWNPEKNDYDFIESWRD